MPPNTYAVICSFDWGVKRVKSKKFEPESDEMRPSGSESPPEALRQALQLWESIYSEKDGDKSDQPTQRGKIFLAGVLVGFLCSRLLTEESCLLSFVG